MLNAADFGGVVACGILSYPVDPRSFARSALRKGK